MADRKYRVVRPHMGDKEYAEGDIRTADPDEVKHLVPRVLEPIAVAPKAKAPTPKPAAKPKAKPAPRKRKGR